MTHSELALWMKITFKLEIEPDSSTITKMFSPKEMARLKALQAETNPFNLDKKSAQSSNFPELENKLFSWFRRNESRHAVMTDDVVIEKARDFAREMGLSEFKGSGHWFLHFKKRVSQIPYSMVCDHVR